MITMKRGDNTTEAFVKEGKSVVKADGSWKTPEEMRAAADGGGDGQGGGNRGRWMGGMLRMVKAPGEAANELVGKIEKFEEKEGALTATLNAEQVRDLVSMGGRRREGSNAPEPKDASGTVTFWLKDGQLAKMETHVKATMTFNGEDRDIDRKTTTEITGIGSSPVVVPEEVAKKLGSAEKPAASPQ